MGERMSRDMLGRGIRRVSGTIMASDSAKGARDLAGPGSDAAGPPARGFEGGGRDSRAFVDGSAHGRGRADQGPSFGPGDRPMRSSFSAFPWAIFSLVIRGRSTARNQSAPACALAMG